VNVACGDGQTIAVTSTGEVYGWGCYKDKEGKKWFTAVENSDSIRRSQDTPMLIGGISGAIDVACGSVFNIARCDDGSIYSWGLGECGELARQVPPMKQGEEYNETAIRKHHLSPGSMYTSMVTASGAVVQDSVPVRDAKAIGCGAYHSLVVLVNPLSSKSSQLHSVCECVLTTVLYYIAVDENACALFSTGLNNYGQLGLGDTTNRVFLTHVLGTDHVHLTEVKGGVHHSLALSSAGDVYAWGRGDSGQLGNALLCVVAKTSSYIVLRNNKSVALSCWRLSSQS
jgi:regulator of chromosome condensation